MSDKLDNIDQLLEGTDAKLTEIGYERLGENLQDLIAQREAAAIQAFGERLLELLKDESIKPGTYYGKTAAEDRNHLRKELRTAIQEAMQSTSPDGSASYGEQQ